jgi:carboxypeptidase D
VEAGDFDETQLDSLHVRSPVEDQRDVRYSLGGESDDEEDEEEGGEGKGKEKGGKKVNGGSS